MPHQKPFPYARERRIITTLFHTLGVEVHREFFPRRKHGETMTTLFIFGGVVVGEADGRPMSASKLAGYLNIPRTTVLRNLRILMRRSLVRKHGNLYHVNVEAVSTPASAKLTLRNKRMIIKAATQLSETDTASVRKMTKV